ncbi:hypothetical protein GH714_039631 [Hevea brasiliensis]|uniref:Protein kinase domain-containing protein n=1 Tax=Hevea brasiliensis TaxID=3981 RepID=A0A6A6MZV2_HEVBR|nr:hypothetical protein GH714_039631 [Hevea brasiliensis]
MFLPSLASSDIQSLPRLPTLIICSKTLTAFTFVILFVFNKVIISGIIGEHYANQSEEEDSKPQKPAQPKKPVLAVGQYPGSLLKLSAWMSLVKKVLLLIKPALSQIAPPELRWKMQSRVSPLPRRDRKTSNHLDFERAPAYCSAFEVDPMSTVRKDAPLKYLSVTVFENCSPEIVRDFYMDNDYRKQWDKALVEHKQLDVDKTNGTEVGRTIKKFPFLTPREYILAWRLWEGKDKTFYCFIKVPPGLEQMDIVVDTPANPAVITMDGLLTDVNKERKFLKKPSRKVLANGLLLIGGVICLSRGHSNLGVKVAMAYILTKLRKHNASPGQSRERKLSDLGLTGSMGYQLSNLKSVTYFDMSKNNLNNDIPYQLPPNVAHLDFSNNGFSGNVPYSISQMTELEYLNLGHNQLKGQLSDMFQKLPKLKTLDLSYNSLSGNLPHSFASLSKLNTLHLQNNQFTGSINVLAGLPLNKLTGGNSWSSGPAPPPPPGAKPISAKLKDHEIGGNGKNGMSGLALANNSGFIGESESFDSIDTKTLQKSPSIGYKPPHSDFAQSLNDNEFASRLNASRSTSIHAVPYSLADLQTATGNFAAGRLIGEGSLGRVYRAKYPDGKNMDSNNLICSPLSGFSCQKIDSSLFQTGRPEQFSEIISSISRVHHPNIAELVGYCSEKGHNMLIYEYLRNGSLHEFLHMSDDFSKPLTWNTRVRIALGTARAVEYLHEVCSPSFIHKNIKSSNILLDLELNPRLSDYGLANFHHRTSQNLGVGYNAPECTKPSAYTMKSDIYSFGVVMLELLTGRMPVDLSKPKSEQCLARWATPQLHDIEALERMVDPALRGLYPPKSLSRFADIIALCVQSEPEFRPPMSEVVQALVRLVQRSSMNMRDDLAASRRTEDSDY